MLSVLVGVLMERSSSLKLLKKDKKDFDIYIIDVDGNNLTQVTINKSYDGMPYWTKDNYLYFVSDRGNVEENLQIWRFKLSY